jgi:hypothetical protein
MVMDIPVKFKCTISSSYEEYSQYKAQPHYRMILYSFCEKEAIITPEGLHYLVSLPVTRIYNRNTTYYILD